MFYLQTYNRSFNMGGSSSKPTPALPAPPKPTTPPPPVNTISVCAVKKVELNQLTRDINVKQTEVDSCDPVGAQARRTQTAISENQAYVDQKRSELTQAIKEFNAQKSIVRKIADAIEPLKQYADALGSEVETMNTKKKKLESAERTRRRDFLDSNPQDGVSGILGIRTSDDKILLLFWICYILAITVVTIILMTMFEAQIGGDMKKKLSIGGTVLIVAWGIAYYCITKFG